MSSFEFVLPTIQNWSCHNCGGCCRQHAIYITEAERQRILSQGWDGKLGVPNTDDLFVPEKSQGSGKNSRRATPWRLAQHDDGACVFLDEKGLCRIHGKFGEEAKPLACRIYPYAFHPAGDSLAVSLRFSCPSVARNQGRSISEQLNELRTISSLVVPESALSIPAPEIRRGIRLGWDDILRVVEGLILTLSPEDATIDLKLLRALFWLDLLKNTQFERIRESVLEELLVLIVEAAAVEMPKLPADIAPPAGIARTQFRLLAGQYARKDVASLIDRSFRGRLRQLESAWKLSQGKGTLPALHADLKPVAFDALEKSYGPLPADAQEMLTRYYLVKVQGLHFCGRGYYDFPLIEGFQSLALTYPVILWLGRWFAVSQGRDRWNSDDIVKALNVVDHQHGYSKVLATWSARRRVRNLVATEDLQRLIVWYGK